jgi:hypothetical protein
MVARQKKALPPSRPEFLGGLQTKKNWGYLNEFSRKKFEKAKKVTKLPALTEIIANGICARMAWTRGFQMRKTSTMKEIQQDKPQEALVRPHCYVKQVLHHCPGPRGHVQQERRHGLLQNHH